ncbi:MAG: PEP-CTERM sorting domain-containing protein [Gemmatimonadota bacterium]
MTAHARSHSARKIAVTTAFLAAAVLPASARAQYTTSFAMHQEGGAPWCIDAPSQGALTEAHCGPTLLSESFARVDAYGDLANFGIAVGQQAAGQHSFSTQTQTSAQAGLFGSYFSAFAATQTDYLRWRFDLSSSISASQSASAELNLNLTNGQQQSAYWAINHNGQVSGSNYTLTQSGIDMFSAAVEGSDTFYFVANALGIATNGASASSGGFTLAGVDWYNGENTLVRSATLGENGLVSFDEQQDVTPEPSSLFLLATGAVSVVAIRRRRAT